MKVSIGYTFNKNDLDVCESFDITSPEENLEIQLTIK